MSTRIDPEYGTETSIDDYTVADVEACGTRRFRPTVNVEMPMVTPEAFEMLYGRIKHACPTAWKPILAELARRLHERDPRAVDYAINKAGRLDIRPLDYIGTRSSGWTEYRDPSEAARALEIETSSKAKLAPKVSAAKLVERKREAPRTPKPAPVCEIIDWPSWATEWLERLVYGPKREYAHAWLAHIIGGADQPSDPGTDWADKVRRRCEWLRG